VGATLEIRRFGYNSQMRKFVVAAWERRRHRERELREVEAETAEHAVVAVAVSRTGGDEVVYEAWPDDDPSSNLRMILGRGNRGDQQLSL
jgi:hypothetical protein